MLPNNVKFDEIKKIVSKSVYDRLIEKKTTTKEEDLALRKELLKTSCKTKNEEELEKLMSLLAPYIQNKTRPLLFMADEKNRVREETLTTIEKMLFEQKKTLKGEEKTSKVSVIGDTMHIDQIDVTISVEDDPFTSLDHTDKVLDQMKLLEEEKRKWDEEKLL